MRRVKDWIDSFLEYSSNSEAPTIYRRWAAVSAIASMLRRNCWLQWHQKIYPNMYIVLIGPSGGRKGTAMRLTGDMLRELNVRMAAEAITREALIRELFQSTTTETAGNVVYEHCSLTIFSEELAVFLGQQNLQLISDLTDWYDCKDVWTYRTKNHGTDEIQGVWVNIIGATTPTILQSSLPQDAIGGGLTSRMIFVYAPGKEKLIPVPFITEEAEALRKLLVQDLEEISLLRGMFRVDKEFLTQWTKWYVEQEGSLKNLSDRHFHGYKERRPTHVLKLCMILNASRTDEMIIQAQDLFRAIEYITEVEASMPRVFAGYGRMETSDLIPMIMSMIMEKKEVPKSVLMKEFLSDLSLGQLDEILRGLETAKFCQIMLRDGRQIIRYIPSNHQEVLSKTVHPPHPTHET